MIVIPMVMSTIMWLTTLLAGAVAAAQAGAPQGDVDGVLRGLAGGRLQLDDVRLETQCLDDGRFVHASAYGNGVAIWNDERQSALAREQVMILVKAFEREGFARMPESFGGDERNPARMAVKMTCHVHFSGAGARKDVIQLDKGEQSPALKRLARSILDTARVATQNARPIDSLEEGLAAVAAGGVAVETLRIRMRVGMSGGKADPRGLVLRIDGRDLEIEPDAGAKTTRRLEAPEVRDVARVLAENGFAALPINLARTGFVDVSVAILGKEHAVQARRFAETPEPDPRIRARFEKAIAPLIALQER
jgi:hypothetical protein